jgi:homotetrameric cytidine deaminase
MAQNAPIDPSLQVLLASARKVAERAYAPYSKFRVGAALQLSNGNVITGTNVENASIGLTVCAERAALVRAVTKHGPQIRIQAVAVANLNDAPSPPCGACRQFLSEFIEPDASVIFPAAAGFAVVPFAELFPSGFDLKHR